MCVPSLLKPLIVWGAFESALLSLLSVSTFKMTIFEGLLIIILSKTAKRLLGLVNNLDNGVFHCETFSSMDPSSSKRSHVSSGTTPNKPAEKRARDEKRRIRKPLDFSSENVTVSSEIGGSLSPENVTVSCQVGGLLSPAIRSHGSPSFKVCMLLCLFSISSSLFICLFAIFCDMHKLI